MSVFIEEKPISAKQQEQLKPLLDKGVFLKELVIDDKLKEMHYIFANYQGKLQHFYITDLTDERESLFICKSIWKSIK